MINKRYERFHLGAMNAGARIFGGALLAIGAIFLLTAVLSDSHRLLYAALGLFGIVGGVAFLVVDPIRPGDIEKMVDGTSEHPRTGNYEKRK